MIFRTLGLSFLMQVAASIVLLSVGTIVINLTTGKESTDVMAHPWPALTLGMFAQAIVGVFFYRIVRRLSINRLNYNPVPLDIKQPHAVQELGLGLLLGFLLIGTTVALQAALGYYHPTGFQLVPGILYGLSLGLGAAFVEEPIYRGVMLGKFSEIMSRPKAIALSSVVFGLVHLVSASGSGSDEILGIVGIITASSLVFAGAYYLTHRLWMGIGIHFAWNFTMGGIFGLTISGIPRMDGFIQHTSTAGPHWLTGGAFGPEGSLVLMLLGLLLGTVLLLRAGKSSRVHVSKPQK